MKKTILISSFMAMAITAFTLVQARLAPAAGTGEFEQAQSELNKAQQDLQKAAEDFGQENQNGGLQQNGQTSWSKAVSPAPDNAAKTGSNSQPANPALVGSPETGYAGTWTDPATGDIITSVIAPTPPQNQNYQNYPIIVEPQVNGGYSGNSEQNWQGGYQWPTSPENPGYPPAQQNPPYNAPPPPGWHPYYPGQPYPGFNPYPYPFPQPYPGYNHPWPMPGPPPSFKPGLPGSMPPPINPNYKPLRPGKPPFNPGVNPGPNPGGVPGPNPGGIWQPGMNPPGQGNWRPQPPRPPMPQLPMQPSGQSWHRSPFAPHPPSGGGMFGNPGNIRRGGN